MTSEDYIIEILYKAHKLKIRKAVLKQATIILTNNPNKERLQAFEEAFKEIKKRENLN
jgi:hypothetical protein